MSLDYPSQVLRPPFRRAYRLPFRSPAGIEGIISAAVGNYDGFGIVTDGSGFVTGWNNSSSVTGALPDLDVVLGTLANSSVTLVNGHKAVLSTGSYGLEPPVLQQLPTPFTVFVAAKFNDVSPGANQHLFDARSGVQAIIFTNRGNSDKFTMFQGASIALSEAYSNDPHVFTGQFNGGASSKLTVSGLGSVVGNAGANARWDFGTFFASTAGISTTPGYIAQFLIFAGAVSEAKIAQIQDFLLWKFRFTT